MQASPDAVTWTDIASTSVVDTTSSGAVVKRTITSIGKDNQYVKLIMNGSHLRTTYLYFNKDVPAAVAAQDVALSTDEAATAINATVAYDSDKLEYKGYYGAVGTATVTDNQNGTLNVNVTAATATSGEWLKLVFVKKDGAKGSAQVKVTSITATGATITGGDGVAWCGNAAAGNVLVEFDDGTVGSANDIQLEGAAGTEMTLPTAAARDGYVFGGWYDMFGAPYTETTYPTANTRVFAKWIDDDTLSVGAQITEGTTAGSAKTDLRMVATVDSLHYVNVGFIIQVGENGTPKTRSTTTVYSILRGAGESYKPWEEFSADSRYFYAFNLRQIPTSAFDTKIIITPFWETLDGTTVTGVTRTVTINGLING